MRVRKFAGGLVGYKVLWAPSPAHPNVYAGFGAAYLYALPVPGGFVACYRRGAGKAVFIVGCGGAPWVNVATAVSVGLNSPTWPARVYAAPRAALAAAGKAAKRVL